MLLRYKILLVITIPVIYIIFYEIYQGFSKNPNRTSLENVNKNLDQNLPNLKSGNGFFQKYFMENGGSRTFEEVPLHNPVRTAKPKPEMPPLSQNTQIETSKTQINTPRPVSEEIPKTEHAPPLFKARWVNATCKLFDERLKEYNDEISNIRKAILKARKGSDWVDILPDIRVLWCNRDDFLVELEKYPHIQTIALSWDKSGFRNSEWTSLQDKSNLPLQVYHPWTASHLLCVLIQTPAYTKARWDAVYNRECTTDLNITDSNISLEPLYLHGRPINRQHYWPHNGLSYPYYFYHSVPHQALYMHILQDSIITGLGDVISGNLKLVPYSCSQDIEPSPPRGYRATPGYEEVFVITQYWGESFFHKMLESLPRIAPYVKFLVDNPDVKIHLAEIEGYTQKTLNFLGFDSSRFITGICKSKVVYLPQATPCGFAQAQSTSLMSQLYRSAMDKNMPKQERNSIVLIKRSATRRFTEQRRIERMLTTLASEFGLNLELFKDNPPPPMEAAMLLFRRAVLIVAPHGAGLSNMIYSDPGTAVIEGVCNPPHVNMCYQWAAHILGHRYHGIPSRRGCEDVIDVDALEIEKVARVFLGKR